MTEPPLPHLSGTKDAKKIKNAKFTAFAYLRAALLVGGAVLGISLWRFATASINPTKLSNIGGPALAGFALLLVSYWFVSNKRSK